MITIDEKLKLFGKIIKDKIDKENQALIEEYNEEFGNLLDKKRHEFSQEAERILRENEAGLERERTKLLAKVKLEEKKSILKNEKNIYDDALLELLKLGTGFTEKEEYEEWFMGNFRRLVSGLKDKSVEIMATEVDLARFKNKLQALCVENTPSFVVNSELLGGFILSESSRGLKYDMSILGKIMDSRETIGNMLFNNLL